MKKEAKYTTCINCKSAFNESNTFTKEGWAETQISGMCEKCFDEAFEEVDEED